MTLEAEATEALEEPIQAEEESSDLEGVNDNELAEDEESTDDQVVEESDDVVVTIGDDAPPQDETPAPDWVKELRKSHREVQKRNKELEAKLESLENPESEKIQLGQKPKLEDFDYDSDKFEDALSTWYEQKRQVDQAAEQAKANQQKALDSWKQQLDIYDEQKSNLKVKDFDDAESVILETLDQTQQGIVVQGAENSALVIYALGKSPERAKELASIKDPIKFAFAVAKLEKDLKVTNRKAPPLPEKKVTGTAPSSGTVDSTLQKLRAEAAKTGNYSKVTDYRREHGR